MITQRYVFTSPGSDSLKREIEAVTLEPTPVVFAFDVTWDNNIATQDVVDGVMERAGFHPNGATVALAPTPFLGIKSPDGNVWRIDISNLGVITTTKVT